jgi:hypothetical protein
MRFHIPLLTVYLVYLVYYYITSDRFYEKFVYSTLVIIAIYAASFILESHKRRKLKK